MKCRYLDSNEAIFDEVLATLDIAKFVDIKRIVNLVAFPLAYHLRKSEMRIYLVERDRRFVFLLSVHHLQYYENVFFIKKEKIIKISIKSRIMINVVFFHENNSNYVKSRISELIKKKFLNDE